MLRRSCLCSDRRETPYRVQMPQLSAKASETEPNRLLAVFVVDTNETELTIPFGS